MRSRAAIWAEPEEYRAWADKAVGALQRWYNPRTGLWKSAGWWNCANALIAVIQHGQRTGERRYQHVIETTFGRAQRVNRGFSNEYYDDDGWWALAWIAAFDLTGEVKYLDLARVLFAGMAAGWDDARGGLWWTREKKYKNAIPNGLLLLVAGRLHRRTTGPGSPACGYLDWALREWQWFGSSGLIGPAGLVNDGLTADGANNHGTAWTYNQGVIIGGLSELYDITGDGACLQQAEAIAAAAMGGLTVPPGILAEPEEPRAIGRRDDMAQFKGIFVRNLYELYLRGGRAEYRDFILTNATWLWRNSRNRRNQVGLAWTGPFDRADAARQGSALDALSAAVGVCGRSSAARGLSPSRAPLVSGARAHEHEKMQ
jgi:predicted alpha-1,6-mannanase (GH76 family)